ncbi:MULTISPECIES: gliding motility lipoprotein GldB [Tenacibaculum]|uniref:gliding motility lipoprotein GldB n=1 Tax=Tenacibaculum TaxID=104267 RepID=UPI001F0A70FF|nr:MULTISPECIES: gliding motility lipoprotein GldB [Tenacibaculum]MCH3880963.1 gliding motility lipoprotein GldB [Tenacibaculum aquimarinum]MDO6599436.1 gliding motility lipoprotein GldB [Tenacibaculum sp. 1_MG-2023]
MRKILFYFLISFLFLSCDKESKTIVDVSDISVDFSVNRFDVDFYSSTKDHLQTLKNKYPLLFPKGIQDSVWINKINNKDEQELFAETQKEYKDIGSLKEQFTSFFKHVKYYNPKFVAPNVITMLTNIDYDNRVIYADSLLLVSLDAYLGKNHDFYGSYPQYIKQNNTKEHIIVDVAHAIIQKQILANTERTFLGKMIIEGKKMYLLDIYLPNISDNEKAGYSQEKFNWAIANEEQIWKYFVEKDLLYSTDAKLDKRFMDLAPFSKFYLEEDSKSPGQIGSWIGWQIVRSYMQNNDVSLRQLLQLDTETIFKKSKYKPRR